MSDNWPSFGWWGWLMQGWTKHRAAETLTWLLLDEFTTDEANPLTSPRTCEPGPGSYTIDDGAGVFSIVGSQLAIAKVAVTHYLKSADNNFVDGVGIFSKITPETLGGTIRLGPSASGIVVNGWQSNGTTWLRPLVSVAAIDTGRTGSGPHIVGSIRGGAYTKQVYRDGTSWILDWITDLNAASATYPTIHANDGQGKVDFQKVIDLPANGYTAWDADFSTVTDTKTNPASGATYSCNSDYHERLTFTYEAGKYVGVRNRYAAANTYIGFEASDAGAFKLYENDNGAFKTLYSSAGGHFSDGVSYQIDLVQEGNVLKAFEDNVLITQVATDPDLASNTSGIVIHSLATNDIVLSTHPYPSLGIATSRIIAPQEGDTTTCSSNGLFYIRNHTDPLGSACWYHLRKSDADTYLALKLEGSGNVEFWEFTSGSDTRRIQALAAVSGGDDVCVIYDGTYAEVFVNGTSIGSTTSISTDVPGTQAKFHQAGTGTANPDSIEFYPRDVSSLLPGGLT